MMQIAALRSEMRALRGALEVQRPRVEYANRVVRESAALRSDLAALGNSMEHRRRALTQLRERQMDIDHLATAVAEAARDTTSELRARDRAPPEFSSSSSSGLPAVRPAVAPNRDAMLEAARQRMARLGVASAGLGGSRLPGGGSRGERAHDPSMFDRLRHVREAEERVAKAARDAVQGEPIVTELRLLRTLADECSICLEPRRQGDATWVLHCGHAFHKQCAERWLSGANGCPLCKRPVERRHHKAGDQHPLLAGAGAAGGRSTAGSAPQDASSRAPAPGDRLADGQGADATRGWRPPR